MAPPASVPSWWEFNQAVLVAIRERYQRDSVVPAHARASIERLSLDQLDVAAFSQEIHDAFAGVTWYELLTALDGRAPNASHLLLAQLARDGSLCSVVTTNFDTLIERAMRTTGAVSTTFEPLTASPPPAAVGTPVVKLHGTAGHAATLIDLAKQKRRGLPEPWQRWLERRFSSSAVLVLGFSGADLELHEDYLRLQAAATRAPWLRWLVRPGQKPHPKAVEIVQECGTRGGFITGDLPGVFAHFGIAVPQVDPGPLTADDRVTRAMHAWLDEPGVDGDVCGIALARLLTEIGSQTAAAAIRSAIGTKARRDLRAGVSPTHAIRIALVLGQVAADTSEKRPQLALKDLDLAKRAEEAVIDHLRERGPLPSHVEADHSHNIAVLLQNMSYCHVLLDQPDDAERRADEALPHLTSLPDIQLLGHRASDKELRGAIAFLRGETDLARQAWNEALQLAGQGGDQRRAGAVASNLKLVAMQLTAGSQPADKTHAPGCAGTAARVE
jgi:hypothetical protein